jgi:hypothetical protein
VTPSQFSHEAEGLNQVRALLPDHAPFRAWSNFEFLDGHGKWHEVDLLVLGRRQLHLVELKYYSGGLTGTDQRWQRGHSRSEDSPLLLARRKAQRLASKLQLALADWATERGVKIPDARDVVPFVQESVFLHHPSLQCLLPPGSRIDLFGPDDRQNTTTGLPGISQRLLEDATPQQSVTTARSEIIAELMDKLGFVPRRQREAGSWVIDEEPLGEGDGWQDWPAFHRVATTDGARIRFLVTPPGAAAEARARLRRLAEHEYRIMSRLAHDGLQHPRDMVDSELGVGLVYGLDDRYQRLDLWLADQASGTSVTDQISVLRQVAETVAYAHGNRVVHRGLTPHAVSVRAVTGAGVKVLVGDWQSAGTVAGPAPTGFSGDGVTGLFGVSDGPCQAGSGQAGSAAQRLSALLNPGAVDVDRRQAEAFQAPERVTTARLCVWLSAFLFILVSPFVVGCGGESS